MKKNVYVVLSHTGTLLSFIIKVLKRSRLNHASISFVDDLSEMYSFGRVDSANPFIGGFVRESPNFGTMRQFRRTWAEVFCFEVEEEIYNRLQAMAEKMYQNRKSYKYNYKGLFLAIFNVSSHAPYRYYCSEFVAMMLREGNIIPKDALTEVAHPMDMYALPGSTLVYAGPLRAYRQRFKIYDLRDKWYDFKKKHFKKKSKKKKYQYRPPVR